MIEAPVENVPMFDLNVKIADSEYDDVLEGCLETARHWRKKRAQRMQGMQMGRLWSSVAYQYICRARGS